jgi:hypothetical protein
MDVQNFIFFALLAVHWQESVDNLISMGFRLYRVSLYLVLRHNFKARSDDSCNRKS